MNTLPDRCISKSRAVSVGYMYLAVVCNNSIQSIETSAMLSLPLAIKCLMLTYIGSTGQVLHYSSK